jgi:hypothetical protein
MKREEIPYGPGDRVYLASRYSYGNIQPGDQGNVIAIEDGIFPGDFYTRIVTDDGRKAAAFSWRFKKVENTYD